MDESLLDPYLDPRDRSRGGPRSKLTGDELAELRRRLADDDLSKEDRARLADEYGVTTRSINRLVRRLSRGEMQEVGVLGWRAWFRRTSFGPHQVTRWLPGDPTDDSGGGHAMNNREDES